MSVIASITSPQTAGPEHYDSESVHKLVRATWGFDSLRPLQQRAIAAGLEHRDSLVVMPTGGGKSLCYQVPPLVANRTDVVVSPLISLMKDQVDGLAACGYRALAIHGGMSNDERERARKEFASAPPNLIFAAPERLIAPRFIEWLRTLNVRAFAIDEAHCISHWGHDFRREYRRLSELRQLFPNASVHAFTATATPRVREDIARQLHLRDPLVLVGSFDRPNLIYRVVPRVDAGGQVLEVLRRHQNEAVIIYCISRRETEQLAAFLKSRGYVAEAYHAGMTPEARRQTQDGFRSERLNIVVATVAFGMGIDRSNVRCVIHTAMPKSVEHYQQETGRAGRDGLEAECVLLYSPTDVTKWARLMERSQGDEAPPPPEVVQAQLVLLEQLRAYCQPVACRHRQLVEYFGQQYEMENCKACDVCLGELGDFEDATVTAQKILSCVARVEERFGAGHVIDVLRGGNTDMVRKWSHDRLSTYGILKDVPRKVLLNQLHQMLDQGLLVRSDDKFMQLSLNEASWEVLRGQRRVMLQKQPDAVERVAADPEQAWEGVDRGLFDELRTLRRQLAGAAGVPPYVVFGDATLRDMARRRPQSASAMRQIYGMGDKKFAEYGDIFLECIKQYCQTHGLSEDMSAAPVRPESSGFEPNARSTTASRSHALDLFARGASIDDVMAQTGRARSTVEGDLTLFIEQTAPESIDSWVERPTCVRIIEAADQVGRQRLKPIFEALGGEVPYTEIRIVLAHERAMGCRPQYATHG